MADIVGFFPGDGVIYSAMFDTRMAGSHGLVSLGGLAITSADGIPVEARADHMVRMTRNCELAAMCMPPVRADNRPRCRAQLILSGWLEGWLASAGIECSRVRLGDALLEAGVSRAEELPARSDAMLPNFAELSKDMFGKDKIGLAQAAWAALRARKGLR